MKKRSLNAVLIAFLVFFTGISAFVLLYPLVRSLVPDDRWLAAIVLVYLFALRFCGRLVARVLVRSSGTE